MTAHIENWFQTVTMRLDYFYLIWIEIPASGSAS
jgi:hypothetical protein